LPFHKPNNEVGPQELKPHPKNIPGRFWVDQSCLSHECCTAIAPMHFVLDSDGVTVYVYSQPRTEEEVALCKEALESCPVAAIHDDLTD
jgi:ferredoxin